MTKTTYNTFDDVMTALESAGFKFTFVKGNKLGNSYEYDGATFTLLDNNDDWIFRYYVLSDELMFSKHFTLVNDNSLRLISMLTNNNCDLIDKRYIERESAQLYVDFEELNSYD